MSKHATAEAPPELTFDRRKVKVAEVIGVDLIEVNMHPLALEDVKAAIAIHCMRVGDITIRSGISERSAGGEVRNEIGEVAAYSFDQLFDYCKSLGEIHLDAVDALDHILRAEDAWIALQSQGTRGNDAIALWGDIRESLSNAANQVPLKMRQPPERPFDIWDYNKRRADENREAFDEKWCYEYIAKVFGWWLPQDDYAIRFHRNKEPDRAKIDEEVATPGKHYNSRAWVHPNDVAKVAVLKSKLAALRCRILGKVLANLAM